MSVGLTKWARLRIILVGLGLACFGLVLIGRFLQLQIIQGPQLREVLDREVKKQCPVLPVRGTILDRHNKELAVSTQVYSLVAHPNQIKNADLISRELSKVLGMSYHEIKKIITRARPFVFVKRCLTPEKEEAFRLWKEKIESRVIAERKRDDRADEDAVYLIPEARRYYPQQALAGPVLGFCDIDGNGLEGLECYFNKYLYGKPKSSINLLDARGRIVVCGEKAWDPDVMGDNLVLTIDRTIQYIAEKELRKGVEHWNAAGGMIMVSDPRTGEILAMAQVPNMDPNMPGNYSEAARKVRVLTDAIEPGSAFKVFIVASALDAGVVKPSETFNCENGTWHVNAKSVIHDVHPYGGLSVQQIITKSSNIGAAKISMKLGPKFMDEYLRSFGFGAKTGIQFPGETTGLMKNHQRCRSPIDRLTTAFGQGVSVSVLQLTMALSAIGNQGVLMQPILVKEIVSPRGDIVKEFKPRPVRRVLSQQTAATMLKIMETVTEPGGTAVGASPPGFTTAGKTGTAQKIVGRAYSHNKYNSVFMGLIPAENPALAITVIVEESKGAIYGGVVAAPIFKEVAAQALRVLGIYPQPDKTDSVLAKNKPAIPQHPAAPEPPVIPVNTADLTGFLELSKLSRQPETPAKPLKVMPDLKGMTMRHAMRLMSAAGIRCHAQGSGLAVSQTPQPGTPLEPGTDCVVQFEPHS
uniref:PASTA domain-containing protein n=1 Tax=Desulfobacca acetoxidans TaxID=60893 RepID=A0A7V6DPZ6_9BACT